MVKYGLVFLEATLLAFFQGLQCGFIAIAEPVGIAKQPRGIHAPMQLSHACVPLPGLPPNRWTSVPSCEAA